MKIVLKIGGNEIDDPAFVEKTAKLVAAIASDAHQLLVVHGGGKEVTAAMSRSGIAVKFVDGFRYTDAQSLAIVEMVLSGSINKRLVRAFQLLGVNALGLSGVDSGLFQAEKINRNGKDVGLVGEIKSVNTKALDLLMNDFVVVMSPVSMDLKSGDALNVNADYAAAAAASAIGADLAIFLSNVPGVMKDGAVIDTLRSDEFNKLKSAGVISGGMVPKVEAALKATSSGVKYAYISDAEGAVSIVSRKDSGTRVIA